MTSQSKPSRLLACCLALLFPAAIAHAQQATLLKDSKELLDQGIRLHDEGRFKEALRCYRQIPAGDTNYAVAVYEQVLTLNADSSFAEARDKAREGLRLLYGNNQRDLMLNLGHAYDYMGKPDSALQQYDALIAANPYDSQPWYEKGATYSLQKEYHKATVCFKKALMLNPYHFRSHYMMGFCYLMQGRLSEAWLAAATSLFMTNNPELGQTAINMLAGIKNQTDEVVKAFNNRKSAGSTAFDETDDLIHSKIALSRDYKYDSELAGDGIVNVTHMLMEKLKYDADDTSFVMQYYVPLYNRIYKEDLFDPFILLMFSGNEIEAIERMARKNKRDVKEAKTVIFPYMDHIASTQVLRYADRKSAAMKMVLIPSEKTLMICNLKSREPFTVGEGPVMMYKDGSLLSSGNMTASGEKTGEWKYFYRNGQLRLVENYRNGKAHGEVISYYQNGNLKSKSIYNNGDETELQEYNNRGTLTSSVTVKGSQKTTKNYHDNGVVEYSLQFENDIPKDGVIKTYHDNGALLRELPLAKGKKEGEYKEYDREGRLTEKGTYRNNKREGEFLTYKNGKLREKTTYAADKTDGLYEEYNEDGKLIQKSIFRNGQKHGTEYYYRGDGTEYGTITYKNGAPESYRFTGKDGKVLAESNDHKMSTLPYYNEEGWLVSEIPYEGSQVNGLAKYYYAAGNLRNTVNYENSIRNGEAVDYYRSGKKKSETVYKDNSDNGYYKHFSSTGKLKSEGVLIEDTRQGIWKFYNDAGQLEQEVFYINGKMNGPEKNYFANGKLNYIDWYDFGVLTSMVQYDSTGKELLRESFPGGSGRYRLLHPNGKVFFECNMKGGLYTGAFKKYYPDGNLLETGFFNNGSRDSLAESYYPTGVLQSKGTSKKGERHGKWFFYDEAGLPEYEMEYVNGEQQGNEKIYYGNILRYENNFKDGQQDGEQIVYGEDKKVAAVLIYKEGNLIGYTYEGKDGARLPVTPVKNGTAHITTTYSNGNKGVDLNFKSNMRDGKQQYYFSNGQIAEERSFVTGNLEGAVHKWLPNGKPLFDCIYKGDEQFGKSEFYSQDGSLLCSRNFEEGGILHGKATFVHPKTKKSVTLHYYHGIMIAAQ